MKKIIPLFVLCFLIIGSTSAFARYYDPKNGRFLSTDPIGYKDSMNLYQYCNNNPVNWVDPWGLMVINNSDEYIVIKGEDDQDGYTVVPPGGVYEDDQDGVIFDDGSIFKNNNGEDVVVTDNGVVSHDSIYDNVFDDFLKSLANIYGFQDFDLSGWYNSNDGTKTGKWDSGDKLKEIQEKNKNKVCK